jgi:hypothetical protein
MQARPTNAQAERAIRIARRCSRVSAAGKLSVHEEFPTPVAELVRAFIS